jgi:hypothetical protein
MGVSMKGGYPAFRREMGLTAKGIQFTNIGSQLELQIDFPKHMIGMVVYPICHDYSSSICSFHGFLTVFPWFLGDFPLILVNMFASNPLLGFEPPRPVGDQPKPRGARAWAAVRGRGWRESAGGRSPMGKSDRESGWERQTFEEFVWGVSWIIPFWDCYLLYIMFFI